MDARRKTTPKPSASADPKVIDRHVIYNGRKFDFEQLTVRRPNGKTMQREVVKHPGAVVVVAITANQELVLIRNYRIAVGERLVECCAGTLEPPEPPRVCAKRELIEETGYRAAKITPLGGGWFYTTPGLTNEKMYAFAATGLTHVGQKLEEDESIDVEIVPVAEALDMVYSGKMRDAKSMIAILLAHRAGLLGKPSRPKVRRGR
jgi:ADP-ribose pyrophosphatase